LQENLVSVDIRLNEAELAVIEAAAPQGIAQGQRYHPNMMTLLDG